MVDPDLNFDIKFFKGENHGKVFNNAYTIINNKWYRVRGEVLILNEDNQVLIVKRKKPSNQGNLYNIPGGSAEPDSTIKEQTFIEALEEASVKVKDMQCSHMYYISKYNNPIKDRENYEQKYEGSISVIYVARFDKYVNIPRRDFWDIETAKYYKFYDIDKVELSQIHKEAIDAYLKGEL